MATKVEKSLWDDEWLKPKSSLLMGLQHPISEQEKVQRLSPCGGVGASAPKNTALNYSYYNKKV